MNRAQTADSISGDISRYAIHSAIGGVVSALAIFAGLFFIGATVNLLFFGDITVVEYVASICYLAVFAAVAVGFVRLADASEKKVKSAWMRLYGETVWLTPGGETGKVIDVSMSGSTLTLGFEVGDKRAYAFQHLTPKDQGKHADLKALGDNLMPKFAFMDRNVNFAILATLFIWVLVAALTFSLWDSSSMWTCLTLLSLVVFTFFTPCAILIENAGSVKASHVSDHAVHIAQTRWKALDGKVGVVRWAQRVYKGEGRYEETIVLSFPDGRVCEYRREDVMPIAFEPALAA